MPAPIVYFDIASPDAEALRAFYMRVFDWSIDEHGAIEGSGAIRGTLRQDPAEKILYIAVPSIDEALKEVEAAGGKIVAPRTVVPNIVIFALFLDPAGNRMGLVEIAG